MSASAIRAGAAYIELQLRDGVSRPLHNASVALKEFGNAVAWQGARIAALGTAITAPLAAMAHTFARSTLEAGRFANRRDAANVAAYVSALTALSNAMTNLRNALGSAVLPLMTRWPAALARIINQATVWVIRNRALVQSVAILASRVAMAGAAIVVLGKGIATAGSVLGFLSGVASAAATGVAMIGGILAAIMTPLGAVIAGLVALGAYLLYTTGAGEQALGWLADAFGGLQADATQAWQGIIDSLVAGDIQQAAQVFWGFLKLEWEKGKNALNQIWINAKDFFLQVWSNASFTAAGYFIDAWALVENGWVETIDFLADTWAIFTNILTKTWHTTIGFIQKAWVRLKALFDKDIDVNAEINEIDNRTNAQWKQADDRQNAEIGARNESRKKRKAEIEQGRQAAQANLGQDKAAEDSGRAAEFERQRKASEQAVQQSRADFNAATDTAKKKREKAELQMGKADIPGLSIPMAAEKSKLESKGSFNAMAVRGLGSSSLADRTAKATEKSVDLLKKIDDNTKKAGVLFQ